MLTIRSFHIIKMALLIIRVFGVVAVGVWVFVKSNI